MDILKFDDKYGKELKTQFGLHNTIITFKQIRGKKKKKKKKKKKAVTSASLTGRSD